MRVTEGCLCVGECFSAFCVYRSVSSNCTVISPGGQFFRGDKGRLLGLQPQWQGERYPKASEHHENTLLYIHKHTPLTQHRPVWLWSTQVLWVLSHCAACLSWQWEKPIVQKKKKLLIMWKCRQCEQITIQAYMFFFFSTNTNWPFRQTQLGRSNKLTYKPPR